VCAGGERRLTGRLTGYFPGSSAVRLLWKVPTDLDRMSGRQKYQSRFRRSSHPRGGLKNGVRDVCRNYDDDHRARIWGGGVRVGGSAIDLSRATRSSALRCAGQSSPAVG